MFRYDQEHPDRIRTAICKHRGIQDSGPSEMAKHLRPLSVGERRETPVIPECVIKGVVKLPDAAAFRYFAGRDDLAPGAPSSTWPTSVALGRLRRRIHLIVDKSLFRFEPRILQQRMIVGGIL